MCRRKLITGQRHGSLLIIMEIERKNSSGTYDVIVFCRDCNTAKRMQKARFGGARIVDNCGCRYSRKRKEWCNKHPSSLRQQAVDGRHHLTVAYGRLHTKNLR